MRSPRRSSPLSSLLLSALVAAPLAAQGSAAAAGPIPTIETSGEGEAKIAPDRATISVAVQTKGTTAALAGSENATRVTAVLEAIRRAGIPREQISTVDYNVSPSYRYFPDGRKPQLTGYDAHNTVRVEVRALDLVGKVIDAALAAGATNVGGVSFWASQLDATQRTALGAATADARLNAEAMAKAAGGTLGTLILLTTQETPRVEFAPMAMAARGMVAKVADEPTPIEVPQEQTVTSRVVGRWQFIPNAAPR